MFRRKRETSDFGAEIDVHIELETERLQDQGLSYQAARTAALLAFGNVTQAPERFNESGRWLWIEHLWQEFVSVSACCARSLLSRRSRCSRWRWELEPIRNFQHRECCVVALPSLSRS